MKTDYHNRMKTDYLQMFNPTVRADHVYSVASYLPDIYGCTSIYVRESMGFYYPLRCYIAKGQVLVDIF